MNRAIESAIRVDPSQYFWVHKRFKTRPAGMPAFYRDDGGTGDVEARRRKR
jgi:KDO2-lipid IV(A) lauroyltransferase